MAFIASRMSRGKRYWSIVESRRVNGRPRQTILEYLGTAETLLQKLNEPGDVSIKSYTHGDVTALLAIAKELNIVDIINNHASSCANGRKTNRDHLTTGESLILAAVGRACHPTSKLGWYDWCKTTSLEYHFGMSLKKLDSQHFWDQMDRVPEDKIPMIEEEIVEMLMGKYGMKLDNLLFDTTNFFTYIASDNNHCQIPLRGKNKQKRMDLRQFGLALLVTKNEHLPLFHKTYEGNKHDAVVFKEIIRNLINRVKNITTQLFDITIIFDKGNNSKENFNMLGTEKDFYYVGGLVPAHFKDIIKKANKRFEYTRIDGEKTAVYRVKRNIWGEDRTCVVSISEQLKEGQIRGIVQHLTKKYKELNHFKEQLENRQRKKSFSKTEIAKKLLVVIKGQFIEDILKYKFIKLKAGGFSFSYFLDEKAFHKIQDEILGRKIFVTNRHDWTNEEIITAYRSQYNIEHVFRKMKNPYHLCIRPQFHWTDQKIKVHVLICLIGYMLATAAYNKARNQAGYSKGLNMFMEELGNIRLCIKTKNKTRQIAYQLESIPQEMKKVIDFLGITEERIKLAL